VISFNDFNSVGKGLGNCLFQYAFLRTTARRLGVKFYCPEWIGDHVFMLDDQEERTEKAVRMSRSYREPFKNCGFNAKALNIEDDTNIRGFFQTAKYFNAGDVKKWYAFQNHKIQRVREKFQSIDFSESVGVHLRFGDKKTQLQYVMPSEGYYKKALKKVKHKKNILIFSDEPQYAEKYLKSVEGNLQFIGGNEAYEDLYLMSLCRDFVSSISTLSWWGAWLNRYNDATIVVPKEWLRPGYVVRNQDLHCDGWISLRCSIPLWDNYHVVFWKRKLLGG